MNSCALLPTAWQIGLSLGSSQARGLLKPFNTHAHTFTKAICLSLPVDSVAAALKNEKKTADFALGALRLLSLLLSPPTFSLLKVS